MLHRKILVLQKCGQVFSNILFIKTMPQHMYYSFTLPASFLMASLKCHSSSFSSQNCSNGSWQIEHTYACKRTIIKPIPKSHFNNSINYYCTSSEVSPASTRQLVWSCSDDAGCSLFSLKSFSGSWGSKVSSVGGKMRAWKHTSCDSWPQIFMAGKFVHSIHRLERDI